MKVTPFACFPVLRILPERAARLYGRWGVGALRFAPRRRGYFFSIAAFILAIFLRRARYCASQMNTKIPRNTAA